MGSALLLLAVAAPIFVRFAPILLVAPSEQRCLPRFADIVPWRVLDNRRRLLAASAGQPLEDRLAALVAATAVQMEAPAKESVRELKAPPFALTGVVAVVVVGHRDRSVDPYAPTRSVKSTKSGTTRRVPVEPELRPLLSRLHDERKGKDGERGLWLPDHEDRAVLLREHLKTARVDRTELFADDAQRKRITIQDLRATGITWAAVRGDDTLRIKQRAGHKSFSTTEGYIREAENLRDGFGSAFPPLPPDLLAARPGGGFG